MKRKIKITLIVALAAMSFTACKKENIVLPTMPGTYIRATSPVEIRIDKWKQTHASMDLGVPPMTKVYVTAITDSVAVCINDYCYKLYRGQWAMACTLPYDGIRAEDEHLAKILKGK